MAAAITFLPVHDVAELASGFKIMIFMLINACVIVLRSSSGSHAWYQPGWKTPKILYPWIQLLGIFGGAALIFMMGVKSLIGASVAIFLGLIIYSSYGKKSAKVEITPWNTTLKLLTDPDEAELMRRCAAFHEADTEGVGKLGEGEFVNAIRALGYISDGGPNIPDESIVISRTRSSSENRVVREIFHSGDSDGDGLLDLEEFLETAEEIDIAE